MKQREEATGEREGLEILRATSEEKHTTLTPKAPRQDLRYLSMTEIGFGPEFTLNEDFVVWLCPTCGHTFCWPAATTILMPNTTCTCSWPQSVTQMQIVFSSQGEG